MNLFDYVNSITIGSIAAEMATNLEQWYRPLTAMIVYGIAAFAVHYGTCKNRNVRLWLSGQAIPLMENGTIYKAELDRAKIDLNEFLAQARVAGYFDLNEVQCAMLETSGLEMSQNAMHLSWSAAEVDEKLHAIMHGIHAQCVKYGTEPDGYINYVKGANIAGFMKVAHAMMGQGII